MSVTFTVPGEARPERKRQTGRPGGFYKRIDTPDARDYKATVKLCAAQAMAGREPLQDALAVTIRVYRAKPPSWPKKRWAWTTKPDCSNFAKLIEDACTGIVWGDDAQIVRLVVEKHHRPTPGVEVEARVIGEEELSRRN